ncbi:MAG: (Fe-S)-binding protein [Rhodomicrobium sp.]|nr:(Fe-S)-binding protein [Rhodomicrobium sp.]
METLRPKAVTALFEDFKTRLDPGNRLNPGKIVFPAAPNEQMLRSQPHSDGLPALTALDCNGTALCRRLDGGGAMCPSFRLTRNERDAPRGRANTLRLALAGEFGPDALGSDEMAETMALCLSCKACKAECPRSVDIAQAKILTQEARIARTGLSRYERTAAFLPHYAHRMRGRRHFLNLRDILPWAARVSERLTGVSADRPWPHWSAAPFHAGSFALEDRAGESAGREIVLFADTFNSHFDPVTLRAAADVLSASGFRLSLLAPPPGERPYCCGRTFLEAGLVEEAAAEGARLIAAAKPYIQRGAALVGMEPACLLTLRDEFRSTLALDGADELSSASFLFEEIMSEAGASGRVQPKLRRIEADVLVAAHCHQRAFKTAGLARQLAALVPGTAVTEAETACCGMGTLFGYRPDAVAPSLAMGELVLFPQIRRASLDTLMIADGFACRKQISDGTGRTARHTAVLLKLSLAAKEKFGSDGDGGAEKDDKIVKRLRRLRKNYFR